MLSLFQRRMFTQFLPTVRHLSQLVGDSTTSGPAVAALKNYPYFIPRNTRGNIPVYTDVRNGGTRYLIYLRNIEGNVPVLVKDLQTTLFPQESAEAARLNVRITHSKHLVISGGRWRNNVMEWVKERGF